MRTGMIMEIQTIKIDQIRQCLIWFFLTRFDNVQSGKAVFIAKNRYQIIHAAGPLASATGRISQY